MSTPTNRWKIFKNGDKESRMTVDAIDEKDALRVFGNSAGLIVTDRYRAYRADMICACGSFLSAVTGTCVRGQYCPKEPKLAPAALAAGKGTSPDLSADPAAYDRIADRELGPAAGKGEKG